MISGPCARFFAGQEDYGDWNWIEFWWQDGNEERVFHVP
jgi:hypothetical protein